ncbi:MAG: DUF302 domain-containing protein [Bacillota bacterium]
MAGYTMKKELDQPMDTVIEKVQEELSKEGFGILTEIDMKQTFKNKLDKDFREYKIFGACNPSFAFEGFKSVDDLGLLLPCNFIVYKNDNDKVIVATIDPVKLLSISENNEIIELGKRIKKRFEKVINNL